jgi:pimeloyl-ACP methyl ester carboxylesterase
VIFHHSLPLNWDDWGAQRLFIVRHGFLVVAHAPRRHGRSQKDVALLSIKLLKTESSRFSRLPVRDADDVR